MAKKQIGVRLEEDLIKQIDLFVSTNDEIKSRTDFFEKATRKYITNTPQTLSDIHNDLLLLLNKQEKQFEQLEKKFEVQQAKLLEEPKGEKKKKGFFSLFSS